MERVISSVDDKIDYYLHKISSESTLTMLPRDLYEVPVMDEETYLLDQVMLEKGLIKINKDFRVISTKGLEISNFGGWHVYQKQLRRDRYKNQPQSQADKKQQLEIAQLKFQLEALTQELYQKTKKEETTLLIIKNLLHQKRANTIILLIVGCTIGFILANMKWFIDILLQD